MDRQELDIGSTKARVRRLENQLSSLDERLEELFSQLQERPSERELLLLVLGEEG